MKNKITLIGFCVYSVLSGVSQAAVSINVSFSDSTTDNDSVGSGDAGFNATPGVIGVTTANLGSVSDTAELGYRFSGYNAGRGESGSGFRSIQQDIDLWVEWTVSADGGETYDFSIDSTIGASLRIFDDFADESGDQAIFGVLTATLTQNGFDVSNGDLNMTGGSRFGDGFSNVDDTASRVFSGLTGTNTFRLQYEATIVSTWKFATIGNNRTANGILWGEDGTMGGDSEFNNNFDEYSNPANKPDDGLFVSSSIEVTAVPEPAAVALIMGLVGSLFLVRRRRQT